MARAAFGGGEDPHLTIIDIPPASRDYYRSELPHVHVMKDIGRLTVQGAQYN